MTSRERFRETLLFGHPDKVTLSPGGPRESTLRMWRTQGLPEGVPHEAVLNQILEDAGAEPMVPKGSAPQIGVGVSFQMIPTFEEKVLEHKDGHYIVQDWMGAITEISDEYDYTYIRSARDFVTRKWHKFPVESHDDWEEMKTRYDPKGPGRFPDDFEDRCRALENRDHVCAIHFNGPFWQMREWCGMENLCMLMADDPELVDEMAAFWTEFASATMAPILERIELDAVALSEDMAYKGHSMISQAMARRYLLPSYRRWVEESKSSGCPMVMMDSDGFIGELIPIWIESGINCCHPIEVAAGNDIVEFRETFGRKMAYMGGIDKRAIAKGGTVMEAEVMRLVPPLLEDGGFIPGCDHGVPPDISWPNFLEYFRLLARLSGWI